jgi:hypothetical protein
MFGKAPIVPNDKSHNSEFRKKITLIIPNYRNVSEVPYFQKISLTIPKCFHKSHNSDIFSEVLQLRKIILTIPNPS